MIFSRSATLRASSIARCARPARYIRTAELQPWQQTLQRTGRRTYASAHGGHGQAQKSDLPWYVQRHTFYFYPSRPFPSSHSRWLCANTPIFSGLDSLSHQLESVFMLSSARTSATVKAMARDTTIITMRNTRRPTLKKHQQRRRNLKPRRRSLKKNQRASLRMSLRTSPKKSPRENPRSPPSPRAMVPRRKAHPQMSLTRLVSCIQSWTHN